MSLYALSHVGQAIVNALSPDKLSPHSLTGEKWGGSIFVNIMLHVFITKWVKYMSPNGNIAGDSIAFRA